MNRFRISKRGQQTLWSVIGACIVGYFLYHTIQGERGWVSMLRLQHEVTNAQGNLSQLQKEHEELAHRVQLMRPNSLDPDLVEEKSRELLNYSKPGEYVIIDQPQNDQKNQNDVVRRSK